MSALVLSASRHSDAEKHVQIALWLSSLITIHCANLFMCKPFGEGSNPLVLYRTNTSNGEMPYIWMLSTLKCIWVLRSRFEETEVESLMATKRKWHKRKLRKFHGAKSEKKLHFSLSLSFPGIANEMHKIFLCLCHKITHKALSNCMSVWMALFDAHFHTNSHVIRCSLSVNTKKIPLR